MSSTLYYETKTKNQEEIGRAASLLKNNSINKELVNIHCNVHLYSSLDLEIVKKDTPDLETWMIDNQGKSDIDVSAYPNSFAEDAGYEVEDVMEMQVCVFEALNESFEMEYHAYSSGFDLTEDSFTIEQIKRITNNGKLLSYTDEYRVLYSQLLEVEKEELIAITQKPQISSRKLLQSVKENNEDFEWYPTTKEIIEAMYWDIKEWDKHDAISSKYWEQNNISLLDVGAGNGKIFRTIKEISDANPNDDSRESRNYTELKVHSAYAIEKSQILINSLDDDVYVIGTDFHEQTLIDKEVDVVFCNPPYSEFSEWSTKIIKEANAKSIYLVIPDRWESDLDIARAIEQRGAKVDIIGSYDFLESEDRRARAHVHLLKIELIAKRKHGNGFKTTDETDPFNVWFDEVFKVDAEKENAYSFSENEKNIKRVKNLVTGESLIPRLEELYNEEIQHLMSNYMKVAELDGSLLKELNISKDGLKKALKMKIKGLKNLYWKELFDNLEMITSKLTSKSRESLLGTLTKHTSVDFTVSNAYSIILWAIKNANKYYDSQLLSLYFSYSNSKSIKNYKSNKKLVEDGWRYESRHGNREKKHTKFSLEYRIVLGDYFSEVLDFDYDGNVRGLKPRAQTSFQDLFTIAGNLGFNVVDGNTWDREWIAGKNQFFHMKPLSPDGSELEVFVEIKAFKNGNIHYRFNQKFMKALNLEAARLNGWIKSPKEASEEFDISIEEATTHWKSSFTLIPQNLSNLLPAPSKEQEQDIVEIEDVKIEQVEEKENALDSEAVNNTLYSQSEVDTFASGSLF